eukprot:1375957-Prymnesium_polylepis.1
MEAAWKHWRGLTHLAGQRKRPDNFETAFKQLSRQVGRTRAADLERLVAVVAFDNLDLYHCCTRELSFGIHKAKNFTALFGPHGICHL